MENQYRNNVHKLPNYKSLVAANGKVQVLENNSHVDNI